MRHTYTRCGAIFMLVFMVAAPVAAKTATVDKCQTVKDRIERYTVMRRKGGSAIQMQKWKDQLRATEEQFRRLECKDHRRKLR